MVARKTKVAAQALKRRLLHACRWPKSENGLSKHSILLASSGRSGSTWISEVLVSNGKLRFLFEPLHPQWVKCFAGDPARIWLDPADENSLTAKRISELLCGEMSNPWIDQHNRHRNSDKRLIKCIRANLLLPWIRRNLPEVKIVYLIRNPLAQSSSAARGGWYETKHASLEFVRQYPELQKYMKLVDKAAEFANSPITNAVRFWCLENIVVLGELSESDVHLVFYEDVLKTPDSVVPEMFHALNLDLSDDWLENAKRPSKTSRPSGATTQLGNSSHFDSISESDLSNARKILAIFQLDHLYEQEPNPVAKKGNRFLGDRCNEWGFNSESPADQFKSSEDA